MDGVLIINKPTGKTSFDIIREVRKQYNTKQVGHIGTLDPMASGVLPVLVGKATKLSNYLMEHNKEYIATLSLGEKRETGDSEGKIIETKNVDSSIFKKENIDKIKEVLNSFLGESMQIPPMYSAIKVNGEKLYNIARKGIEIERNPRKIVINEIELLNTNYNENDEKAEISFRVVCSKGTYIRTLCEDIANKLGTVGYMSSLKRTRVGTFEIKDENQFIKMEDIFTDIPRICISEENEMNKLLNGISINISNNSNTNIDNKYEGLCNLYYQDKYIGIGDIKNNLVKRKILLEK